MRYNVRKELSQMAEQTDACPEIILKIEEAIEKHGGKITVYDTMDLQLARKN